MASGRLFLGLDTGEALAASDILIQVGTGSARIALTLEHAGGRCSAVSKFSLVPRVPCRYAVLSPTGHAARRENMSTNDERP